MKFEVKPIGVIRSPYKSEDNIPIQSYKSTALGEAELFEGYSEGLDSLDGFSHIILLYWFHKTRIFKPRVTPYLDTEERGLFSTRAPSRPNPIGISIVRMVKIDGNIVKFEGADMLDGTPLIDIKPFVPEFDNREHATSGWLTNQFADENHDYLGDDRFAK